MSKLDNIKESIILESDRIEEDVRLKKEQPLIVYIPLVKGISSNQQWNKNDLLMLEMK